MSGKRRELPHPDQPRLFLSEAQSTYLLGADGKALKTAQSRREKVSASVGGKKNEEEVHPHTVKKRPVRKVKLPKHFFDAAESTWSLVAEARNINVVSPQRAPEQIALEKSLQEKRQKYRFGIIYFLKHPEAFKQEGGNPHEGQPTHLTGIIEINDRDAIAVIPSHVPRMLQAFPESIKKTKRFRP